jgi:hypothetical protein
LALPRRPGSKAEAAVGRLYTACEHLARAEKARALYELVISWTSIESVATAAAKRSDERLPGFES